MLIGFKRQFAPYVLDGSKRHTIRDRLMNGAWTGNLIHWAYEMPYKGK